MCTIQDKAETLAGLLKRHIYEITHIPLKAQFHSKNFSGNAKLYAGVISEIFMLKFYKFKHYYHNEYPLLYMQIIYSEILNSFISFWKKHNLLKEHIDSAQLLECFISNMSIEFGQIGELELQRILRDVL